MSARKSRPVACVGSCQFGRNRHTTGQNSIMRSIRIRIQVVQTDNVVQFNGERLHYTSRATQRPREAGRCLEGAQRRAGQLSTGLCLPGKTSISSPRQTNEYLIDCRVPVGTPALMPQISIGYSRCREAPLAQLDGTTFDRLTRARTGLIALSAVAQNIPAKTFGACTLNSTISSWLTIPESPPT